MPSTPQRSPADPTLRRERLIAAAFALNNITEQGGENRGQMVELMLHEVGLPAGEPWCAAYVYHVGYWSQYDSTTQHSAWPLPKTGACATLGAFATVHDMLEPAPQRGDVFLMYFSTLHRFAHTGIVLSVTETGTSYLCTTIEGNTNDDGSRDGWKTCVKSRVFKKGDGHRFIRWDALA
jgi:CHAP domain